uniref:Protein GrpE-like n=1 Tax=Nicotiana tabacum TaxID=4097 RepID=A0A1S4B817_TOBAC|nr:PREDICTED: protein GrpE-like [Nicotiana tabacum]
MRAIVENVDGAAAEDASDEGDNAAADETASFIATLLQLYRDALANNDDSKVAEIEISLKSIEEEKIELQRKVASLTEELSSERDRVLRISADFDNFRKRTERERLSLVKNAQGEVVEKLLSILDNFERAKMQIKVATEGEEKINNSYQSISKKFGEILGSLGVETVVTVGKPFDPLASGIEKDPVPGKSRIWQEMAEELTSERNQLLGERDQIVLRPSELESKATEAVVLEACLQQSEQEVDVVLAATKREAATAEKVTNLEAALNSKIEELAAVGEKHAQLEEKYKKTIKHNRLFSSTVRDLDVNLKSASSELTKTEKGSEGDDTEDQTGEALKFECEHFSSSWFRRR